MSCNCNQIDPCSPTPCAEGDTSCNCVQKDMSTDCSVYTGDDLTCSGILKNTVLTTVIQQLDEFICTVRDEILLYVAQVTTLLNIGGGAEVFKQANGLGNKELRTIVSENTTHLDVVQNADTIGIRGGVHRLELDSPTDILSLIVNTLGGDTVLSNIDLSEYNYDTFVQNATFDTGTLDLTITRNNGEPDIVVPLDFLNNHLESASYGATTNIVTFTLTDASTVQLDLSVLVNEILTTAADNQVQSDVLETNVSSKAFILNKNATKTVVLGVAGNYNVVDGDNNYVIEIDNGANDVTVNLAGVTITDNFFTGFVQKGTGTVTFTNYNVSPEGLGDIIFGQGHVAAVQIIASTKYLHGTLKAA